MGGTPPGVDSSPGDELSATAMAPSGWSDLPMDLLLSILQRLELPQALAFAAVCTSWCSAAIAAGIPCSRRPWLVSWGNFLEQRELQLKSKMKWVPAAATCKFRHLLDADKVYNVNFPKGCFVACCGASHGWLFLVNDLSNLVSQIPSPSRHRQSTTARPRGGLPIAVVRRLLHRHPHAASISPLLAPGLHALAVSRQPRQYGTTPSRSAALRRSLQGSNHSAADGPTLHASATTEQRQQRLKNQPL